MCIYVLIQVVVIVEILMPGHLMVSVINMVLIMILLVNSLIDLKAYPKDYCKYLQFHTFHNMLFA
jgi:hypothetical protein